LYRLRVDVGAVAVERAADGPVGVRARDDDTVCARLQRLGRGHHLAGHESLRGGFEVVVLVGRRDLVDARLGVLALGATLVVLTDVAGVYADPEDPETRIESVATPDEYEALEAAAEGFMTRKVMAATEALEGGASGVVIASANADRPIRDALDGDGTHIYPEAIQ